MVASTMAGTVVGKGAVGESGSVATVEYKVKAREKVLMKVSTIETSLCGNTGAFALLFVNGTFQAFGSITDKGDSIQASAAPGDHIVAYVATHPIPNEIVCIRLGDLYFHLIQHD